MGFTVVEWSTRTIRGPYHFNNLNGSQQQFYNSTFIVNCAKFMNCDSSNHVKLNVMLTKLMWSEYLLYFLGK